MFHALPKFLLFHFLENSGEFWMTDQDDEDLQMAMRMSMQTSPPEAKRSKPRENAPAGEEATPSSSAESPEDKSRRMRRELMAAAAERRLMSAKIASPVKSAPLSSPSVPVEMVQERKSEVSEASTVKSAALSGPVNIPVEIELSIDEANNLFRVVFGSNTSKDILGQWTNQGISFSPDPETWMGLVQHEGGPCGVLAAIQAFFLKYVLFVLEESMTIGSIRQQSLDSKSLSKNDNLLDYFSSLTVDARKRALVRSMGEILFRCGNNKRSVIANLDVLNQYAVGVTDGPNHEEIEKSLDGLPFESASDFQKTLRYATYTYYEDAVQKLEEMIPIFQSRMGAMLFLISALLSRGLDAVQADRDDPSQPLVTAPFGHASQEILNLLLCGQAVANVFDERIDLGGGMFLKGIPSNVEVGFLTLLESLNFCKVGQLLKHPRWPIWVIGSESHYTVLFALDPKVQDENEIEERESKIRKAFDLQDQSGGGGFISVEGFHQVLRETDVNLPSEKLDKICSTGFILWSEFWQLLLDLDKNLGGLKDPSGLMGSKVFDLYHFNGIAKSVLNQNNTESREIPVQRPRLTKLRVMVPPRWTPEEYMTDGSSNQTIRAHTAKPEPSQHAPLVDCIRTRWARASCSWDGHAPSIV